MCTQTGIYHNNDYEVIEENVRVQNNSDNNNHHNENMFAHFTHMLHEH